MSLLTIEQHLANLKNLLGQLSPKVEEAHAAFNQALAARDMAIHLIQQIENPPAGGLGSVDIKDVVSAAQTVIK